MSESSEERKGYETDWVADCAYGYGYGYTKEQALEEMAKHVRSSDGEIEVVLIEHVGNVTTSLSGIEVDEFVSGEKVTLPSDDLEELKHLAIESGGKAARLLDGAEHVEELTMGTD